MFSELLKGTVILLACQTHRLVPESEEQELSHKKKQKKTGTNAILTALFHYRYAPKWPN